MHLSHASAEPSAFPAVLLLIGAQQRLGSLQLPCSSDSAQAAALLGCDKVIAAA